MSAESYKHSAHIRVQYNQRSGGFGPSGYSLLLQGTKEQIGKSVANAVASGLESGAAKITLIPVQPHEVWDLDRNPPT